MSCLAQFFSVRRTALRDGRECPTDPLPTAVERVHLVYSHTTAGRSSRFRSPWYRCSCVFMLLWIAVSTVQP